jgi:hypothetical protein
MGRTWGRRGRTPVVAALGLACQLMLYRALPPKGR